MADVPRTPPVPPSQRKGQGLAWLVCGRRTTWLVLVVWLSVMFAAFPLASKLTGAQDNDAASWLPGSAESTQVLQASEDPVGTVSARD